MVLVLDELFLVLIVELLMTMETIIDDDCLYPWYQELIAQMVQKVDSYDLFEKRDFVLIKVLFKNDKIVDRFYCRDESLFLYYHSLLVFIEDFTNNKRWSFRGLNIGIFVSSFVHIFVFSWVISNNTYWHAKDIIKFPFGKVYKVLFAKSDTLYKGCSCC